MRLLYRVHNPPTLNIRMSVFFGGCNRIICNFKNNTKKKKNDVEVLVAV